MLCSWRTRCRNKKICTSEFISGPDVRLTQAGEISFQDPIYVCWLKTEYFAKKWRRSVEQGRRGTAGNASEFSAEIRYVVESTGIAGFRDAAAGFLTLDLCLNLNVFGLLTEARNAQMYTPIGGWSMTGEQLYIGLTRLLYPFLAGLLLEWLKKF